MNPIGIVPPQEGVENLSAAKQLLVGNDISSSDINQAILYAHGAVEKLFRTYLGQKDFVPKEIRDDADNLHRTHFPDLIAGMCDYGRPSLTPLRSEATEFNKTRNPVAHAKDDGDLTDARRAVGFAEKVYNQYSQIELPSPAGWGTESGQRIDAKASGTATKPNYASQKSSSLPAKKEPRKIINPFVKEPQKAHWLTKYPSDDNYRAVWVKGKKAKVPGIGSFRCPIREFDTVVFVWMHEGQLPIDLSSTRFLSEDNLQIQVQIELTSKVKDSELALITVATRFEDCLPVVQAEIASIVQVFCKSRPAAAIVSSETELAVEISERVQSSVVKLPIQISKAVAQLSIPLIEKSSEEKIATAIDYEQAEAKEKYEASLSQIRDSRTLEELKNHLAREKKRLKADCDNQLAKAETQVKSEMVRLEYLGKMSKLTEEFKTAIFHIAPDIYRDIELAKISSLDDQRVKARTEVIELLKSLAEVSKNKVPIIIVLGAIISNAT